MTGSNRREGDAVSNGEARAGLAEEVTFKQRLAQGEGVSEGFSRCPGPEVGAWWQVEACKGGRRVISQSKGGVGWRSFARALALTLSETRSHGGTWGGHCLGVCALWGPVSWALGRAVGLVEKTS